MSLMQDSYEFPTGFELEFETDPTFSPSSMTENDLIFTDDEGATFDLAPLSEISPSSVGCRTGLGSDSLLPLGETSGFNLSFPSLVAPTPFQDHINIEFLLIETMQMNGEVQGFVPHDAESSFGFLDGGGVNPTDFSSDSCLSDDSQTSFVEAHVECSLEEAPLGTTSKNDEPERKRGRESDENERKQGTVIDVNHFSINAPKVEPLSKRRRVYNNGSIKEELLASAHSSTSSKTPKRSTERKHQKHGFCRCASEQVICNFRRDPAPNTKIPKKAAIEESLSRHVRSEHILPMVERIKLIEKSAWTDSEFIWVRIVEERIQLPKSALYELIDSKKPKNYPTKNYDSPIILFNNPVSAAGYEPLRLEEINAELILDYALLVSKSASTIAKLQNLQNEITRRRLTLPLSSL